MNRKTYKEQITQTVLDQIGDSSLTFEKAYKDWWQNPRTSGGLRLTSVGDLSFRYAGLEYHDHDFKQTKKSYYQFALDLDRKIKCPYYIDVNKNSEGKVKSFIRLYDDRISMMLALYGDLDSYLDSVRTER